jgi:hypothetical protein
MLRRVSLTRTPFRAVGGDCCVFRCLARKRDRRRLGMFHEPSRPDINIYCKQSDAFEVSTRSVRPHRAKQRWRRAPLTDRHTLTYQRRMYRTDRPGHSPSSFSGFLHAYLTGGFECRRSCFAFSATVWFLYMRGPSDGRPPGRDEMYCGCFLASIIAREFSVQFDGSAAPS